MDQKTKIILSLAMFIVVFCASREAYAAPVVSGVSGGVNHNASVTISGGGFGTKTIAATYRWDNFEQGEDGELVIGWSGGTGSDIARYSNELTRGTVGHSVASKYEFRPSSQNISLCQND